MSKRTVILTLATILMAVPAPVLAQRPGRGAMRGQGRMRMEMEGRIRARFEQRLFADLRLTAQERSSVRDVMETFHQRRREVAQREREARQRVRDLETLRANGEEIPEADARAVLAAIMELRDEEAQLFKDEQAALLETLRPDQVLSLLQAREVFGEQIRRLRGRGGGPPGAGLMPDRFQPTRDPPPV